MLLYKLITKDIKTHHDIQTEMPQQEEVHRTKTKLKGETNDVPLTSEYGGSHMARVVNIFFRERLVFRRERSRGCRAHRTSYKTTTSMISRTQQPQGKGRLLENGLEQSGHYHRDWVRFLGGRGCCPNSTTRVSCMRSRRREEVN